MNSELTPRQWELYIFLKKNCDRYVHLKDIAVEVYGFDLDNLHDFGNSGARRSITADITAINDSAVIQKIIITSPRGVKLATKDEVQSFLNTKYKTAIQAFRRARNFKKKVSRDGQMRIVFNSERDTVKTFIDSDKAFGERLKLCRAQKGYSQATVVCEMRKRGDNTFDAPMLSKFENGYCVPNKATLHKLAEIYAVTPDYLYTGVTTPEAVPFEISDLQVE
jgi:hypothetical protein